MKIIFCLLTSMVLFCGCATVSKDNSSRNRKGCQGAIPPEENVNASREMSFDGAESRERVYAYSSEMVDEAVQAVIGTMHGNVTSVNDGKKECSGKNMMNDVYVSAQVMKIGDKETKVRASVNAKKTEDSATRFLLYQLFFAEIETQLLKKQTMSDKEIQVDREKEIIRLISGMLKAFSQKNQNK